MDVICEEPPWMVDLPRLNPRTPSGRKWRGHGERLACLPCALPGTTAGDPVRATALAFRRRCSCCGCSMVGPFCLPIFDHGRARWTPDGCLIGWIPGPMHRSCGLYSGLACPMFKYRSSRQRSQPDAPQFRGDAAVFVFNGYGTAYSAEPHGFGFRHQFAYSELVERIEFENSRDLLPLYEDAVAAEAKEIDTGTRLYWGDSAADEQRLKECAAEDEARIAAKLQEIAEQVKTG